MKPFLVMLICWLAGIGRAAAAGDGDGLSKRIRAMAEPTENHERLGALVGRWRARGFVRLTPDTNPEMATCQAEYRWVIGNRFVEQTLSCLVVARKLNALGHFGYDNYTQSFVGSWLDNYDTGIKTLEGESSGSSIAFRLTHNDPRFEEKVTHDAALTIESGSSHRWQIFERDPKTGRRVAVVDIRYTRIEERP